MDRERLQSNFRKVQWINFFWMFLVIMPVAVPYFRWHGLDMRQVYILQTVFATLIVLFEVPSGYVSDHIGRKSTLMLSGLSAGAAFTWFAVADSFADFVIFETLAAIGASLYSGADVALIYDTDEALRRELPEERGERSGISSLGRRLFYAQLGETTASIAGGLLVLVSLQLPAAVNAITAWVPFFLALSLEEPPRQRQNQGKSHLDQLGEVWSLLFRRSQLVRAILLNLVFYGLATLLAVWAFQDLWQSQGVPLAWFGWLWAGYNLTVALVGRIAHSVEDRIGSAPVVVIIGLLPVIGYFGMAWGGAVVGIFFGLCFQVARGLTQVVLKDALNTRVPTDYRATANSVSTLGVRAGFALLGPLFGWTIDRWGHDVALQSAGVLYVVVFLVVCLPFLALRSTFRDPRKPVA